MASKYVDADKDTLQHRLRFLDIETNPSRKLMPIEGYANEPLVPLEEAVKPLVGLVHDIQTKANWAKWKCADPPADNLTQDQSSAIILYSMQWEPTDKCLFAVLNSVLRDENRTQLKPWFRYLKLFLTALGNLPSTPQVVYRGIKHNLRQEYQQGKTIIWWGFSSCTRTLGVLNADQFLGASGPRTLFNIECTSGKNIEKHSAFSFEAETILPAARQFQVVSCLPQGNDLYVVQLKETKSPVRLIELILETPLSEKPCSKEISSTPEIAQLKISEPLTSKPPYPAQWQTDGVSVAGGHGKGEKANQLHWPHGLCVDDDQTVYIADYGNNRIMAWKAGATTGEVLAGGNNCGDDLDQLDGPTDVIVDQQTDSLLICDRSNGRVMRWPRRPSSHRQPEIIIDNIECHGLTMDDQGSLYVSDIDEDEVRRYDKNGDKKGTVVAGGHGNGANLNQLNDPTYLFVDAESTLYVSDSKNHRVMKWMKGAKEGIVVAGGNWEGRNLTQLSAPQGVWVDGCGHVYVVDQGNHRVVRWEKGAKEGTLIVDGNVKEAKANQSFLPEGLFFDRHGHLYVADWDNHRIQRFSLC